MNNKTVSERLKYLRSINKKTQKEFAEFLGIPQPSMSAYENGKNNPTIDVLIDIADKCKVSLDWLAGRSDYTFGLSSMKDFVLFMYELAMKKEIGFEIIVEDKFPNNDIETNENKWNIKLGNLTIGAMQKTSNAQQGWLYAFAKTILKTASALTSKRR